MVMRMQTGFFCLIIVTILFSFAGCKCIECDADSECSPSKCCPAEAAHPAEKPAAAVLDAYQKAGFDVALEDGRLWILLPGEEKSEKHITLIGAGPDKRSIKANDRNTAIKYLAAKPGFQVQVDKDQRIWVFTADEPAEMSEKHITRIGVGPLGSTLKATSRETLDAYMSVN